MSSKSHSDATLRTNINENGLNFRLTAKCYFSNCGYFVPEQHKIHIGTMFIQTITSNVIQNVHFLWGFTCLVLLCELVDGVGEAVEPGVAGHQHQEAHGDHLHCAG